MPRDSNHHHATFNANMDRRALLRRSGAVATGAALAGGLRYGTAAKPGQAPAFIQDKGEVVIYNWYQPWIADVSPMFEEETGIKVTQLGTYSSNDEWWARLNSGESFDFFIPTTDWVQRAMAAELLTPLDLEQIPNYQNIMEDYQRLEPHMTGDEVFAVPFAQVYYALVYNTDEFPEAPTSWEVTWDETYEGKITLHDQAFARVGTTALLLGDDPLNPTMWDEIKARLIEQKPLVTKYWKDYQNGMELFVNEQAVVGQLTAGRTRMAQDLGAPVQWTVPDEGVLTFLDAFAVPKTAENPENGHRFIDFLIRGDVMAKEMTMMRYDTVNQAAYDELDEAERATFAPPEDAKLVLSTDIKASVRKQIDDLWNEVVLS